MKKLLSILTINLFAALVCFSQSNSPVLFLTAKGDMLTQNNSSIQQDGPGVIYNIMAAASDNSGIYIKKTTNIPVSITLKSGYTIRDVSDFRVTIKDDVSGQVVLDEVFSRFGQPVLPYSGTIPSSHYTVTIDAMNVIQANVNGITKTVQGATTWSFATSGSLGIEVWR